MAQVAKRPIIFERYSSSNPAKSSILSSFVGVKSLAELRVCLVGIFWRTKIIAVN